MTRRLFEYVSLALFVATSMVLIALEQQVVGLGLLAVGMLSTLAGSAEFRRNMLLLYGCVLILFIIPIVTTTAPPQSIYMGLGLVSVVAIPYIVTRYIYKNNLIRFPSLKDRDWTWRRTVYILLIGVVSYLLIPFMLRDTGSYTNWSFSADFMGSLSAYAALNVVGIWDELFFVCTTLAILRRYFPFAVANIAQAVLFTSFLYVLAFEGWCVPVIFVFALLQGYIFRETKSLLFILAIHLTVDLVLHFAILELNHPGYFPYFIT